MTDLAIDTPDSPPGLAGSGSSCCSTVRSSSLSSSIADSTDVDYTQFQEIGLGTDQMMQAPSDTKVSTIPFGLRRTTSSQASVCSARPVRQNAVPIPIPTTRDLINQAPRGPYPPHPRVSKGYGPSASLGLPGPMPMRNKLARNASTPSLAIKAMSNYNRSRSPSPQSPTSTQTLQPPIPSPSARFLQQTRFRGPNQARRVDKPAQKPQELPVRRGSLPSKRKTVKELEAECIDNEDDDDLPDEASLWNVPLSPRPMGERISPLSSIPQPQLYSQFVASPTIIQRSPALSPSASPERPSPLRASMGSDGLETIVAKTSLSLSPLTITGRRTLPANFPSSPISPRRLIRGVSTGILPDHPGTARSKSWNVALSELSEEAKDLTVALEDFDNVTDPKLRPASKASALEKLTRTKSTPSVTLPPLRVNDVMLSSLPISKEKERVLSRTRPSWLPPKNPKEEQRHLKEYRSMMESSRQAERRRTSQQAKAQCAQDESRTALLRIWEEHVLPNWDQVIGEPRTRELWWRGVAPKSRAKVWQRAVGNELGLSKVTYQKALQRAKDAESAMANGEITSKDASISPTSSASSRERNRESFTAITADVLVTFPGVHLFQPSAPLHNDLTCLLQAYTMYRSDLPYQSGRTNLIAAFLLLTIGNASETFITLANLLERPIPLAYLTNDTIGISKAHNSITSMLERKSPHVHTRLFLTSAANTDASESPIISTSDTTQSLSLSPGEPGNTYNMIDECLSTMFLNTCPGILSLETIARIWDVYLFDGDSVLVRTSAALLGVLDGRDFHEESRRRISASSISPGLDGAVTNAHTLESGSTTVLICEDAFMEKVREAGRKD